VDEKRTRIEVFEGEGIKIKVVGSIPTKSGLPPLQRKILILDEDFLFLKYEVFLLCIFQMKILSGVMMKILILFFLALISLIILSCDSTETPPVDQTGKLVINSNPAGAHISLMGTNTGKTTPGTIENLDPGNYDGFLFLQYYDTVFFSVKIFSNTTTTVDTILTDGLPMVEFVFDFQTTFNDDSVRFNFTINQDVTMDSIVVQRPIDIVGTYETEKYNFNGQLFEFQNTTGNFKKYYLPSSGGSYPAIQNRNYYFSMFGHKAYGAKVEFRSYYQVGL